MHSLRARLLLAASLTLAFFLVLVGAALNRAFETSARQIQYERMQALVYALLGNLEPNAYGQLSLSGGKLPDSRLERPQSGLEAALYSDSQVLLWGSPSLNDRHQPPTPQAPGEWQLQETAQRFTLLFSLRYRSDAQQARDYTLMVSEDASAYRLQIRNYRRTLWGALTAGAVVLLLLQGAVLRWSLRPLRRLVAELHAVEQGNSETISNDYPTELQPLTAGLNAMISAERNRQSRYRNALGDLAHSLKTPLAVLGGVAERPNSPEAKTVLQEQLGRMRLIVDHQLKRAATIGARTLAQPVPLKPMLEKTAAALGKVYRDAELQFGIDVPKDLVLRADAGDLYELLGNVLDNAAKYSRGKVHISAERLSPQVVQVRVEDDGLGFPDDAESMLQRGVRADTRQEGQGLGLAAVKDIVEAYGGTLSLSKSKLGGAAVLIVLSA